MVTSSGHTPACLISLNNSRASLGRLAREYPDNMAVHATTSLWGISSNTLLATSNSPAFTCATSNPDQDTTSTSKPRRKTSSNTLLAKRVIPLWAYKCISPFWTCKWLQNPNFKTAPCISLWWVKGVVLERDLSKNVKEN